MRKASESTWFTTLAALRESDPDWEAIAAYREPIARLLARSAPWVPAETRDDAVQEVLLALKTRAVARYDASQGRFRDYLAGVVKNQLRRVLRQRQSGVGSTERSPDESGAPPAGALDDDLAEVDLAALLVQAVGRAQSKLMSQGDAGREVLYCFADRLVHGLDYAAIAVKEELSRDAVKRRLQSARREVLLALLELERETPGAAEPPARLGRRAEQRLLEAIQAGLERGQPVNPSAGLTWRWPPGAVEAGQRLVDRLRAGRRWFPGLEAPDGQAFVSALAGVLDPVVDSSAERSGALESAGGYEEGRSPPCRDRARGGAERSGALESAGGYEGGRSPPCRGRETSA